MIDLPPALTGVVVLFMVLVAVASAEEHRPTSMVLASAAMAVDASVDERETGTVAVLMVRSADDPAGDQRTTTSSRADDAVSPGEMSGPSVDAPAVAAWYRLAAAEHSISDHLLRALHQVESNAAPDGCIANLEASGAVGPFQFKPATFGQYGVDANHDGDRDICSFADALFSAARYLRVLGAGDLDSAATRDALVRYGTDPERVLTLALHYRDVSAGTQ